MSFCKEWLDKHLDALGDVIVRQIADYNFQVGLAAWIEQDFATAFESFEISAKSHPIAQYHMGCMLFSGRGTSKDYVRALNFFKASAICVPQSIYSLASIYREGAIGIPQDKQEALQWLNIIATEDQETAAIERDALEKTLSDEQILSAQQSAQEWLKQYPLWNQWIIWTTAVDSDLSWKNTDNSRGL
ncbi:tetratricopeptide repeat protein [Pseudodesulfovibrio pelocollis]|uniref:tetratricopeptide repeat protein n=1 Tax=Pseudodesulfovibrio pelocollis TaxID=3051432 RepID=UPI00255B0204|nr:hypothetical protein [Pseudodesulfovibrio sp. SB368]